VKIVVHQKYGSRAVPNNTEKLGRNQVLGGTAALEAGIRVSYQKKETTIRIEITKGASTIADAHPSEDPDVMANMNKMRATVRMDTPPMSRLFHFLPSILTFSSCDGTSNRQIPAIGKATIATNQNTQDQLAY